MTVQVCILVHVLVHSATKWHVLSFDLNKCRAKHINQIFMTVKAGILVQVLVHFAIKCHVLSSQDVNKCRAKHVNCIFMTVCKSVFWSMFWYTLLQNDMYFLLIWISVGQNMLTKFYDCVKASILVQVLVHFAIKCHVLSS